MHNTGPQMYFRWPVMFHLKETADLEQDRALSNTTRTPLTARERERESLRKPKPASIISEYSDSLILNSLLTLFSVKLTSKNIRYNV